MSKLSLVSLYPETTADGIAFVDVGCSGSVAPTWEKLFPLLVYTGFDPNADECLRLGALEHPFKSARYLPYAIAGQNGEQNLVITKSLYCSSLLRPNHVWLRRFTYADLFTEIGSEPVRCVTLDELAAQENLRADILKLDTQGMELPILQSGANILDGAFCVETETGFVENYVGETTYAQVDAFMRGHGFLMFDLTMHRIGRNNALAEHGRQQPMWCEAVWLRDFIGNGDAPDRGQAIKSLIICQALEYYDYGLELAQYYRQHGIIDAKEFEKIEKVETWTPGRVRKAPGSRTGRVLQHLPDSINDRLWYGLREIMEG